MVRYLNPELQPVIVDQIDLSYNTFIKGVDQVLYYKLTNKGYSYCLYL